MLTGCLGDVCIHTMPCRVGRLSCLCGDPGQAARMRLGWAGEVLVGAEPLGMVPNSPTSIRRCCWRSCASLSARPTRPPSTSSTTCWPALTAPCGELGGGGGKVTVPGPGGLRGVPRGANLGVYSCRTELHFNHLAENNVFGIAPLSKVAAIGLGGGCGSLAHSGTGGGRAGLPHQWLPLLSTARGKAEGDPAVQQAPGCHEGDGHLQR